MGSPHRKTLAKAGFGQLPPGMIEFHELRLSGKLSAKWTYLSSSRLLARFHITTYSTYLIISGIATRGSAKYAGSHIIIVGFRRTIRYSALLILI